MEYKVTQKKLSKSKHYMALVFESNIYATKEDVNRV